MNSIHQHTGRENGVEAFLSSYPPPVSSIVHLLRSLLRDNFPEAIEQIDYPAKMLAYGFKNTYKDMICVIMPYKNWVNLGFPRGASLPDPLNLLDGTGKRARHVKISSIDEIDLPALVDLIRASIAQIQK